MKYRTPFSIFLAALVILLISSRDSYASKIHNYPVRPPQSIEHALGTLNLDSLNSRNISVTFWSAEDAASRLENIKETARARTDPSLTHIGVNIGDNPELAQAYLRRDALDSDTLQLIASPEATTALQKYGLGTLYR